MGRLFYESEFSEAIKKRCCYDVVTGLFYLCTVKPPGTSKKCCFVTSLLPATFNKAVLYLIIRCIRFIVNVKHIKFHFTSEY